MAHLHYLLNEMCVIVTCSKTLIHEFKETYFAQKIA
jgi:hypothetical protein